MSRPDSMANNTTREIVIIPIRFLCLWYREFNQNLQDRRLMTRARKYAYSGSRLQFFESGQVWIGYLRYFPETQFHLRGRLFHFFSSLYPVPISGTHFLPPAAKP